MSATQNKYVFSSRVNSPSPVSVGREDCVTPHGHFPSQTNVHKLCNNRPQYWAADSFCGRQECQL